VLGAPAWSGVSPRGRPAVARFSLNFIFKNKKKLKIKKINKKN